MFATQNRQRVERFANLCLDFTIFALLAVVPFILGGRHPVAKFAIACVTIPGCIGLAIKVIGGRNISLTFWQALLVIACLAIPAIQLLPLGSPLSRRLAPGVEQQFDLEDPLVAAAHVDRQLSLAPKVTAASLPILLCYVAALICFVSRVETQRDVERIFLWLGVAALSLSVVALLQANFGNGKFLWLYDHPSRQPGGIPRGPFQNENHLCSFLAIALPPSLFFLFRQGGAIATPSPILSLGRLFGAVCLIAVVTTIYATPSRGGAAIVVLSVAIWGSFLGLRWIGIRHCPGQMHRLFSIATVGLLSVAVIGFLALLRWLPTLSYWRWKLWIADVQVWKGFPIFGTGVGTHRYVYRAFVDEHYEQTFSTAESSWITLLVESGVVGVSLAAIVVVCMLYAIIRCISKRHSSDHSLILAAAAAGLLVSSIHSIGDFPWYIPACLLPALALLAIVMQMPRLMCFQPKQIELSGELSMVVAIGLLIGTVWASGRLVAPARASVCYDQYRRLVRDSDDADLEQRAVRLLEQTVELDPNHVLARSKLVVQTLADMDQTPGDAGAVNALRQSIALARLCPPESRAYFCAAVSGDRLGMGDSAQLRLLQQAYRLRPVDGRLSLQLALRTTAAGELEQADRHWRDAIELDPRFRKQAMMILLVLYSPEEIIQRLRPTREASALLYSLAAAGNESRQTKIAATHYCSELLRQAEQEPDTLRSKYYFEQGVKVAMVTESPSLQIQAMALFLRRHPSQLSVRLSLAELLVSQGREQDAARQVEKCIALAPYEQQVDRLVLRFEKQFRRSLR